MRRWLNWAALFVLAALMIAALAGLLGGQRAMNHLVETPAARLTVETPAIMRSGVFFETRVLVEATAPIAKPVVGVSASYWRDITINTTEPQAASEKSEQGMFLFEYDALEPGDVLEIKFDGQINPSLLAGTQGEIVLRDDERPIASIPLELTVLP